MKDTIILALSFWFGSVLAMSINNSCLIGAVYIVSFIIAMLLRREQ